MKCPQCQEPITWREDHDYDEHDLEGDGVISVFICDNDNCNVEDIYIFRPIDATM
jgi:hypothetical protein